MGWKDIVHGALDVVGLVPGVGEIADGINAVIYLAEGDHKNAAISAAAMVPLAGIAASAVKIAKTADKVVTAAKVTAKNEKAAQLVKNQIAGKKAEEIVQKKLESTLTEGQEILSHPKVVTATGKTTFPDKVVVDKNTKQVVNPTEVKSGNSKMSTGQADLSTSGGTIQSNKYPEYKGSTIQPGQLNVDVVQP
jgi:hypothetical protein